MAKTITDYEAIDDKLKKLELLKLEGGDDATLANID